MNSKPVKSARLVWKEDSGAIKEYILNKGTVITLGREIGNQIILTNPKVSKHHAEIRGEERAFVILDLGSTNGVFVNGGMIKTTVELHDNDRIEIGDHVISFIAVPEPTPGDLSTRRLNDMESTMDLPVSDVMTQSLPEHPEQPAGAEFRTRIMSSREPGIEETRFEAASPVSATPAAGISAPQAPKPAPAAQPTPVAHPAPAVQPGPVPQLTPAAQPAPQAAPETLEADFDALLQHLQAAQAKSELLKNKATAIRKGVEDGIIRLRQTAAGMQALEAEAAALNLQALLTQLSANPNDVKLLLDLAQAAPLLARFWLSFLTESRSIQQTEQGLEGALKEYLAGKE